MLELHRSSSHVCELPPWWKKVDRRTPQEKRTTNKGMTFLAGLLLVSVGVAHAIWPQRLSLDWPTVALLISGFLFCFSNRVAVLLPYVKKLKLGEAEIELQEKLSDLRANVEKLEEKAPPREVYKARLNVEHIADTSVESTILDLATKDKGAALVRLAIEIEKEMALLCKELGITLQRSTWREMVEALEREGLLDASFARALMEFRDVRNRVIHSGLRGGVQENMLSRALDDGLQLLRLLTVSS